MTGSLCEISYRIDGWRLHSFFTPRAMMYDDVRAPRLENARHDADGGNNIQAGPFFFGIERVRRRGHL